MAKKEKYTLHSLHMKPQWSARTGQIPGKLQGTIAFNDETQTKAFEINIDSELAKKLMLIIVDVIAAHRSNSIINSITEKSEI